MTRVLLTGATGVVGTELHAALRARPDLRTVAVSRRGDLGGGGRGAAAAGGRLHRAVRQFGGPF